jgi:hypothetical protein
MAKRDRRGSTSSTSKGRRPKEASGLRRDDRLQTPGGESERKIRTPRPSPIASELEEINLFGGRQGRQRSATQRQTAPGQADAGVSIPHSGSGRRSRTPLPLLIPGELEEIDLFGGRQARRGKPRRTEENKAARFQHIQDFLHNPSMFNLRSKELGTSSTPEEIEARTGEVRYQIEVIRSLLALLTEELNSLEQAQPQLSAEQTHATQ